MKKTKKELEVFFLDEVLDEIKNQRPKKSKKKKRRIK